ncbi:MAG TPA: YebC/PmpR family DNA-binding transcriptional regulator, partial [bacterium]|nr:YebC/PmpR family DNA-binding transcriptional regulator [bacterium]
MSGHSKWASIKHKKAAVDAKRGKAFTKVIREIMMAARGGGANPDNNPRLRLAIDKARDLNMPADNIKRAIQKATGEGMENQLEEVSYEGYGPAGVAIKLEVVTDNKRRTAAEIRSIFTKQNGSLGEVGCVSWLFSRKGQLTVPRAGVDEDKLISLALDAGAEDVASETDNYLVYTRAEDMDKVRKALEDNQIKVGSGTLSMLPKSSVKVEGKEAEQLLKLLDALEDQEDV